MKTQILHLESYDDRHSILDKLNWGQADRVIIIWPVRGVPLDNKLDLKLIHRRCQSAEIKLALVCKKRQIIDYAHELDIPVFRSLRIAQKVAWEYTLPVAKSIQRPENRRTRAEITELIQEPSEPTWAQSKNARIILFSVSLLAILALAVYLIPGARIEYLPDVETQSLTLELSANPQYNTFNLSGTLPAHRLSITVEGRGEIETTGTIGIPDRHATGIVEFTNLTNQEISIPRGTVLRTSDSSSSIRFTTTTETTLDPDSGAKTSVPVEATNPGSQGNLPAQSLVIIEGDLSRSLTVINQEPTSGGSERMSRSPKLEDYQTLKEDLMASLWETTLEEAQVTLDQKDVILDSVARKAVIIEETFSPPEPQPSSTLSLLLRVEYELLYLNWTELEAMGNAILNATLPAGYHAQAESYQVTSISPPQIDDQENVRWKASLSRQIFAAENLSSSLKKILGRSPEKAADLLQTEMDLSHRPEISTFPDWWPLLPFFQLRIETIDLYQEG